MQEAVPGAVGVGVEAAQAEDPVPYMVGIGQEHTEKAVRTWGVQGELVIGG